MALSSLQFSFPHGVLSVSVRRCGGMAAVSTVSAFLAERTRRRRVGGAWAASERVKHGRPPLHRRAGRPDEKYHVATRMHEEKSWNMLHEQRDVHC